MAASKLIVSKGAKRSEFKTAGAVSKEALDAMLGPTGNLRAPTLSGNGHHKPYPQRCLSAKLARDLSCRRVRTRLHEVPKVIDPVDHVRVVLNNFGESLRIDQ